MNRLALVAAAALSTTLGTGAAVADPQSDKPAPPPQAAQFAKAVGTWDATVESHGDVSKGTETIRVMGDGLWAISDFDGTFSGAPFKGHGVSGYDPAQKKYIGVWVDTMSPFPMHIEGQMDAAGKVLTSKGKMPDPTNPAQMVECSLVETWIDADNRTFSMSMPGPDGKTMEMMKITYKRRK